MRPCEYWQEYGASWEELEEWIVIHGTKTRGADRPVPLVFAAKPMRAKRVFGLALHKQGLITPYDLRRCYARWCEDAGISRTRIRLYMGHREQDMTDTYQGYEKGLEEHLVSDAGLLKDYVGKIPRMLEVWA